MARNRSSVVVMTPDSLYIGMMMVRYNVVVYRFEVKGSTQIGESNRGGTTVNGLCPINACSAKALHNRR